MIAEYVKFRAFMTPAYIGHFNGRSVDIHGRSTLPGGPPRVDKIPIEKVPTPDGRTWREWLDSVRPSLITDDDRNMFGEWTELLHLLCWDLNQDVDWLATGRALRALLKKEQLICFMMEVRSSHLILLSRSAHSPPASRVIPFPSPFAPSTSPVLPDFG